MSRRTFAAGLSAWTVLVAGFVAWVRPTSTVAVILYCQGVLLFGLLYALFGIRATNARLARLGDAASRSERATETLASSLRQEIAELVTANRSDVRASGDRVVSALGKAIKLSNGKLFRQIEALTNLNAMMPFDRPMPATRGYPASPDLLLLLVDLVSQVRPSLIVECGSGTSTLWFARAMRHYGIDGRVVALEHERQYAEQTHRHLEDHELGDLAEVRDASLETFVIDGTQWQWYAGQAWKDLHDIGLVFVDGPPAGIATKARFPALPLLVDRLAPGAVIVVDDLVREDEREIVAEWLEAYPEFSAEKVRLEAGGAILHRRATS